MLLAARGSTRRCIASYSEPLSTHSTRARSPTAASIASASRVRISWRPPGPSAAQAGNARRAARDGRVDLRRAAGGHPGELPTVPLNRAADLEAIGRRDPRAVDVVVDGDADALDVDPTGGLDAHGVASWEEGHAVRSIRGPMIVGRSCVAWIESRAMLSKPGVILQHGPDGPPRRLGDWLRDRGLPFEVHPMWEQPPPDPREYSFVATLGSERSASDTDGFVPSEIAMLRRCDRRRRPGARAVLRRAGGLVGARRWGGEARDSRGWLDRARHP